MIEYDPIPTARRFHESPARVKVLWGPLGTSKTTTALFEYIIQCQESSIPLDGMAVRTSYRELRDSTLKTFREWFDNPERGSISEWRESDFMYLIRLPSASDPKVTLEHILRFRALEKPDDAKKVQSFEGAFVMCDEVSPTFSSTGKASEGMPLEVVEYLNARMRHKFSGKKAHRYTQVIISNPPAPSHWLNKYFLSRDPEELNKRIGGCEVFFVSKEENERNLPDDYYAILCDTFHDPDLVKRLVEGQIVATYSGEAVYPEVTEKNFTPERLKPIEGIPVILGFDYGLTPATLFTQITPSGQWRWLSEVCNFNCSFETHLDQVRTHLHNEFPGFRWRAWGDPAGSQRSPTDEKSCVSMAHEFGFKGELAIRPGMMLWQPRKESMKQRLGRLDSVGQPALLISRSGCPIAAEGMSGAYRYPKTAAGEVGTRPLKNHVSHIINGAEYIATREFSLNPARMQAEPEDKPIVMKPPSPYRPIPRVTPPRSWLAR